MSRVHEPQLTVVLWKWGTKYTPHHVNAVSRALKLHLHIPYQVVCITDDANGLDPDISVMPLPYEAGRINARRLWIFSEEAKMLGERILQLDLDIVIVADITPMVRRDEPFVVWYCEGIGRIGYALNPTMILLNTGHHTFVWEMYKHAGDELVKEANRAGCAASDQAVITYLFTTPALREHRGHKVLSRMPYVPTWQRRDGIINFRIPGGMLSTLPEGTRIVSFHGQYDPANYTHIPWVKEHWSDLKQPVPTSEEVSNGAC